MANFNFIRRKSETERYERAKKLLTNIKNDFLRNDLQKKEIELYEIQTKIIQFFVNHPKLQIIDNANSKGGKEYKLTLKLIAQKSDDTYYVKDNVVMSCCLVGENYVNPRYNIGADYHSLSVISPCGKINYWQQGWSEFLWYQLQHQDKLDDICQELNLMNKNYFNI